MKEKLKFGDLLYRSKSLVEHVGIVMKNGQVLHNTPGVGPALTSYEEYSDGKAVKVVSSELTPQQQQSLVVRALQIVNEAREYKLISFNCEQMATKVLYGVASSEQVRSAVLVGGTTAVVAKALNSRYWWAYGLAGLAIGCVALNANRKYDYVID
ncbi:hypothetical protein A1OQ_11600 [Enterovibrio norvegicus FF-162]|uniref:hypothetical protein n=1 Tax=Enterovibrio norvegicus TaxID=188144 RepID=UPI0002DC0B51|nr:hypothetical protein [Enterovibrio norvegicus]OEE89417.1 hypothetical protein A1OQ_11600 [Enterovibrio norvegicus FF-162]